MTKPRIFPVRIDDELYKDLRKLAYLTEQPIAALIREAIHAKLNDNKKMLTNSDIAI